MPAVYNNWLALRLDLKNQKAVADTLVSVASPLASHASSECFEDVVANCMSNVGQRQISEKKWNLEEQQRLDAYRARVEKDKNRQESLEEARQILQKVQDDLLRDQNNLDLKSPTELSTLSAILSMLHDLSLSTTKSD